MGFGISLGTAHAADGTWLTDFEKAKATASEEGKPILVDFTGSDWCGWCIRLDKEVFSKQEFKDYADENVVLFVADFPRNKPQSEEIIRQNRDLQYKYGVRGFPTVLLMDNEGEIIGHTGYEPGGPTKFIANFGKIIGDYREKALAERDEPKSAEPVLEPVKVAEAKPPASSGGFWSSVGKWFSDLF